MKTQFVIALCTILVLVGGVTPFAALLDPDLVIYFDYEELCALTKSNAMSVKFRL